jgi:hypothetical protein
MQYLMASQVRSSIELSALKVSDPHARAFSDTHLPSSWALTTGLSQMAL